jgi:serine/threonine protein kinase
MGDQWVIMEFVSGESWKIIGRNPNGMPIDQVLWWMRGMCAGVAYLHDHGIVHRDLKPGNIFLDESTKIGDMFGKFIVQPAEQADGNVGTVHHAAEIANGRYGREIDTYAWASFCLRCSPATPFEGESVGGC